MPASEPALASGSNDRLASSATAGAAEAALIQNRQTLSRNERVKQENETTETLPISEVDSDASENVQKHAPKSAIAAGNARDQIRRLNDERDGRCRHERRRDCGLLRERDADGQ